MKGRTEDPVQLKMEKLRLILDKETQVQREKMDSGTASILNSLESTKARARETVENRVMLRNLKVDLREAENVLVKALSVKTRKEAKRMAAMDAISSTESRIEALKGKLQDTITGKDEYAAILHQQSLAFTKLEEKSYEEIERSREVQEAIAWYNRVLGFRIEGGHGVKFIFTNINFENPMEEYSFTIHLENDAYILLHCKPHLSGTEELMHELNRTNGLFKFARIMRSKFQQAVVTEEISVDKYK